jgi:hypothetical protein
VRAREEKEIYSGNAPCFIHESPKKNIRRGQVDENIEKYYYFAEQARLLNTFFPQSSSMTIDDNFDKRPAFLSLSRCLCISSYQKQLMISR